MIAKHPGECKPHPYQDEAYGKGFRVMNACKVDERTTGYRCTVCGPHKEPGRRRAGVYLRSDLIVMRA